MGHVIHYFTGVLVRTAFHMIIVWEVVEVNVHVQRL